MPTKYLELDSTYRNRNLIDNVGPGSFTSQISQTGIGTQITAVDPITYAYPDIVFSRHDTHATLSYAISVATTGFSSQTKFLLTAVAALPNAVNGYFVGAVLSIPTTNLSTPTPVVGVLNYRITEWIRLDNTRFLVSTEIPVPWTASTDLIVVPPGPFVNIFQPSTALAAPGEKNIFLPNSLSIPNYYTGYYLYNQTRNDGYLITSYDKDTHCAKITTTLVWADADVLIVRKQLPRRFEGDGLPYQQSAGASIAAIAALGNAVALSIEGGGAALLADISFVNNFIRFFAGLASTTARIIAVVLQVTTIIGGAVSYVADFTGEEYDIYNNTNTTAVYTNSVLLATAPSVTLPSACEVMNFNVDGYSPFTYNGGNVSQNQPTSYDVTLNSIVLPNVVLSTGGRIAYYPFVYVEIENLSTSSGLNKNSIYSNNPNAYKAVFKVPITDLNHPATTPFVKLTGNGMTQTITFKTNTDMKLTVRLPDGSVFTPSSSDNPAGQRPNPLIQLSALFGMTRI